MKIIKQNCNTIGNKITVKLKSNKDEIIQGLKNEVSLLQNHVGKLESQVSLIWKCIPTAFSPLGWPMCPHKKKKSVSLLEDALMNNEIQMNNAGQYSRLNNIVIQGTPQSVKRKDLEDKVIKWFYNFRVASCELRVVSCDFKKINFKSCEFLFTRSKVILRVANLFGELEMKLRVASYFLRVASCFVQVANLRK